MCVEDACMHICVHVASPEVSVGCFFFSVITPCFLEMCVYVGVGWGSY